MKKALDARAWLGEELGQAKLAKYAEHGIGGRVMLAYLLSMVSKEAHSSASECVSCGCWEGSELFWHLGGCEDAHLLKCWKSSELPWQERLLLREQSLEGRAFGRPCLEAWRCKSGVVVLEFFFLFCNL
jgi:hypothetical protein